jgi:hypothetical protein
MHSAESRHPPGGTDGPAVVRSSSRPVVTVQIPSRSRSKPRDRSSSSRHPPGGTAAGSTARVHSRPKVVRA